jgi:DNA-binding NarL/FixJ family response regulator
MKVEDSLALMPDRRFRKEQRPVGRGSATDPAAVAPVRVAVIGRDAILGEATAAYLRSRPEVVVLEGERRREAEVALLVVDVMTDDVFKTMARFADGAEEPCRFVLVCDLREHQLAKVITLGMISILPRCTATFDQIVETVLNLRDGRTELPGEAIGWLIERLRALQETSIEPNGLSPTGFTQREIEVFRMLADGIETGQIARKLSYSERTVKNIIYRVMARLNLHNRAHAVAYAIRNGAI